jgi:RNA polymerase sigma-70 factor (TIGR02943 family)
MPVTSEIDLAEPSSLPMRWLELHGDTLYTYALRRVRRPEVAEDLVQETLLAGMQALAGFSHRSNARTWLVGILRNKIADHLRARYRNDKIESSALDDDAMFDRHGKWKLAVPRWKGDPQHLAELGELRATLSGCLSKLPVRMSHLFLSRVSDEISTSELCQQLEITSENAWMLMHRAKSRLRQCMTTHWFSDTTRQKE